jgi:hypothetical protein
MTLFKRLFGDLFTAETATEHKETEVLIDEQIRPSLTFLEEYQQWLAEKYHIGILDHLNEQYAIRSSNPNAEVLFHLHASDGSSGFYFSQELPWTREDYQFITHYFKEIILGEGYRLNNSRRRAVMEDGKLIQLDSFYFKLPLSSRIEVPYQQSWGNISLEHKLLDERTLYVKLMANTYNDRNFEPARDFESLMKRLFSY